MTTPMNGFEDPVHDAQRVFRAVLQALSHPGHLVELRNCFGGLADLPDTVPTPLAATLLALTDHETPVWLDGVLSASLGGLLRFQCGAPLADTCADAAFAAIDLRGSTEPPALDRFAWGTSEYPDQSCTLMLTVDDLFTGPAVALRGPGIEHRTTVRAQGLPSSFWKQRREMQQDFPRGVDCLLFDRRHVLGLPRSTIAVVEVG